MTTGNGEEESKKRNMDLVKLFGLSRLVKIIPLCHLATLSLYRDVWVRFCHLRQSCGAILRKRLFIRNRGITLSEQLIFKFGYNTCKISLTLSIQNIRKNSFTFVLTFYLRNMKN